MIQHIETESSVELNVYLWCDAYAWYLWHYVDLETTKHPAIYESYTTDVNLLPPSPGGHHILAQAEFLSEAGIRSRQRAPFDDPPGLGYTYLSQSGAYLPMLPYSLFRKVVLNGAQYGYNSDHGYYYAYGLPYDYGRPTTPDDFRNNFPKVIYQAHLNFYKSLKKRQELSTGVLLGELRESVGLVGKASLAIAQILNALRKGRIKEAANVIRSYGGKATNLKLFDRSEINRLRKQRGEPPVTQSAYAASSWLELQFGWLPILADIYKHIQFMNDRLKDPNASPWMSFAGYSSGTFKGVPNFTNGDPSTHFAYMGITPSVTMNYKYGITATFKVADATIDTLNAIGLLNPLQVVWELVPFSFVIDWFLPVGDWVNGLSATAGLEHIESCNSVKTDSHYRFVFGGLPHTTHYKNIEIFEQSFGRSILAPDHPDSIPPVPWPRIDLSDLLSTWKVLTSLALIKAVFGKN